MTTSTTFTPEQIAQRYGISPDKVRGWIVRGELAAVNVVARLGGKPRWRISAEALEQFERARAPVPVVKVERRRKSKEGVIEFFRGGKAVAR